MMELSDIEKNLEQSINMVKNQLGDTMIKIGSDALAMIKRRVIEEGKDASGQAFPAYSTKPMLVGAKTFKKKSANKFFGKEKNKDHRWVTIKRGDAAYHLAYLEEGYRGLRELELGGGHGDKVDFSYTNAMWGDISIISGASEHDGGTVVIGAKRQEEKDKLTYNTERNIKKGGREILDLSESEINELKEIFMQPILNVFK
jgi:hypothetical protein